MRDYCMEKKAAVGLLDPNLIRPVRPMNTTVGASIDYLS